MAQYWHLGTGDKHLCSECGRLWVPETLSWLFRRLFGIR